MRNEVDSHLRVVDEDRDRLETEIEFFSREDNWQAVKNATMNTVGKDRGKYPDSRWKRKILLAEHSPIRKLRFSWRWVNLPYWVSVHFVRHKVGIEHFVRTQRTDRTGVDRTELPQGAPVSHECEADAQALINISRKRLCNGASPETRAAWRMVREKVAETEPELASCMAPECVYRGFCPEMFGCGYADTPEFQNARKAYTNLISVLSFPGVMTVAVYKGTSGGEIVCRVYNNAADAVCRPESVLEVNGGMAVFTFTIGDGIASTEAGDIYLSVTAALRALKDAPDGEAE